MQNNMYERLSDKNKGFLFCAVGILLLLNTLGVTWFKPLVGICAIGLIGIGLVKLDAHTQLMHFLHKRR